MRIYFLLLLLLLGISFTVAPDSAAQGVDSSSIDIVAIVEGCGDGVIEVGEDCDGVDLGGATCLSEGFTTGSLSCTASCVLNTSACTYTPPPSSSGGGSSSGSSKGSSLVLEGTASPFSMVTILKDAQILATTSADKNANFQILLKGLSSGNYVFSIYSEDSKNIRSSLFTFPVIVSKGALIKVDSIFVAPTVVADKIAVKKGDFIALFGQSVPFASITLIINSAQEFIVHTIADAYGVYVYNFDSSVLEMGEHHVVAKSISAVGNSIQSAQYAFDVGTLNILNTVNISKTCPKKADLNGDCRVNLVDFSIVAFWYQRTLPASFIIREHDHLNGDGVINLIDFSIMAFHWTG